MGKDFPPQPFSTETSSLALPPCSLRLSEDNGSRQVFDPYRKKVVSLTPEEWVRQHLLHYLTDQLGYPPALIRIEAPAIITFPGRSCMRKADVLVFSRQGTPLLLIECKASTLPLNESHLRQLAHYNVHFQAPFLLLTNGLTHCFYPRCGTPLLRTIPSYQWLETAQP